MGSDDETGTSDDNVVRVAFGKPRAAEGGPPPDRAARERNAAKRRSFDDLIAEGKVLVTLDARRPGVVVPPHLKGDPELSLFFSSRFGRADFGWDDDGVRSTLSFGTELFFCDIPWSAVWMLRSAVVDAAVVSPDDVPPECAAAVELALARRDDGPRDGDGSPPPSPRPAAPPPKAGAPHLSLVTPEDGPRGGGA